MTMNTVREPSVQDFTVDPNALAKTAVSAALGQVPVAGKLLSGLVGIFWPDSDKSNQIWDQIEQRVEALVRQELSDTVYRQTQADLTGLVNVLDDYTAVAAPGHSGQVTSENWHAAQAQFHAAIPGFQVSGYEVLLLPLWAPAANMHISLLRDGVLFGTSWGWNDTDYKTALQWLQNAIKDYMAWAARIFGLGMAGALAQGGVDYHGCQPFRAGNQYRTAMIPGVLDAAARWPLFDPTAYKPPVSASDLYLIREIFTDPVGTADDSGVFVMPLQPPAQPISQIAIWDEPQLIDAIQLTYPAGGGPDKVTQTARMGSGTNGTKRVVTVQPGNPIVGVSVWAGNVVQGLSFTFKDGTTSPHFGGTQGTRHDYGFYDEDDNGNKTWQVLSSIYVNGQSAYYHCADTAVFGFQYDRPAKS